MKMIKPIGDRILVEAVEELKSDSIIIIPEMAKEKSTVCIVLALGDGRENRAGVIQPFKVKVGDKILVSKYGGTEIKVDGKECRLIASDDIFAIV